MASCLGLGMHGGSGKGAHQQAETLLETYFTSTDAANTEISPYSINL